jgi:signal transduction histidine kinase
MCDLTVLVVRVWDWYLCRELIEQQGGRVWFESVEGRGSTFFISLPIISDEDFFEASSDDSSSPVTSS